MSPPDARLVAIYPDALLLRDAGACTVYRATWGQTRAAWRLVRASGWGAVRVVVEGARVARIERR